MTIQNFIKKKPYLAWYTKNFEELSDKAAVEAILNYGDWGDVQKMIKILGIRKTEAIFNTQIRQKRCNYNPKIKNYFKLYFKKYF